ncbi:F-box domain-containing protein [Mycena chlorophos]|uniref:F-box domain-containing protein n=1 Tax=Mycena chlorophos TaxID=658473 RepID=A0A8H6VW56_MYCCL|nr:F-box domain-containing protein [Mycena chlorophos]
MSLLERNQAYAYPVLILPPEIVAEIFLHYLPPYPDCPPLRGPGSPTYLLGICRKWRKIALRTPRLWRAMSLGAPITDWNANDAMQWFERSAACRMSLHFDSLLIHALGLPIPILEKHLSRVEFLDWEVSARQSESLVALLRSGPVTSMVDIALSNTWDEPLPVISLKDAHRLRSVFLWNFDYRIDSLPWGSLTTLALLHVALDECLPVVHAARSLIHLKLLIREAGDSYSETSNSIPTKIEHPLLETFLLDTNIAELPPTFDVLSPFVLPALQRLGMTSNSFGFTRDGLEWLEAFIARSRCSLGRLRILHEVDGVYNLVRPELAGECRRVFSRTVVDETGEWDFLLAGDGWTRDVYWVPIETAV